MTPIEIRAAALAAVVELTKVSKDATSDTAIANEWFVNTCFAFGQYISIGTWPDDWTK